MLHATGQPRFLDLDYFKLILVDLLRDADTAMYRAKTTGKAQCAVVDHGMSARLKERLTVDAELRRAIE